jgi:hypothetical protein
MIIMRLYITYSIVMRLNECDGRRFDSFIRYANGPKGTIFRSRSE